MNQYFWRGKISTELVAKKIIEIVGYIFLFNSIVWFSVILSIVVMNSDGNIWSAIFNGMTLFYLSLFVIFQVIPALSILKTQNQNAAMILLLISAVLAAFSVFVEGMIVFSGHGAGPGILLLWLSIALFWFSMTYLAWRAFRATAALKALT